jgi:hypothetical protein
MKLINLISVILLMASCTAGDRYQQFRPLFEQYPSQNVILLSCIRCGCIDDEIKNLLKNQNPDIEKCVFLGDSTCFRNLFPGKKLIHIPQSKIDSLSVDFYNLLIYNKGQIRMVKTEESKNIAGYIAN